MPKLVILGVEMPDDFTPAGYRFQGVQCQQFAGAIAMGAPQLRPMRELHPTETLSLAMLLVRAGVVQIAVRSETDLGEGEAAGDLVMPTGPEDPRVTWEGMVNLATLRVNPEWLAQVAAQQRRIITPT